MAQIDVDLDIFDDDDIIEYISERVERGMITRKDLRPISDSIQGGFHDDDIPERNSLSDVMKQEFIESIFDKYTLEQLEDRLK